MPVLTMEKLLGDTDPIRLGAAGVCHCMETLTGRVRVFPAESVTRHWNAADLLSPETPEPENFVEAEEGESAEMLALPEVLDHA